MEKLWDSFKQLTKQLAVTTQVSGIVLCYRIYHYVDYYLLTYFRAPMSSKAVERALLSSTNAGNILPLISRLNFSRLVDVVDEHRSTPLLLAAKRGQLISVIALLESGADIDHANQNGLTALMLAVINNHYSIFYYLLMRGSNILLYSLTGCTVLQWAIAYSRMDMLELLIKQRQINLNGQYQEGYTPLMNAIFTNKIEVVKWLLSHGSQLDEFNNDGESALVLAKKMKRDAIYNYLEKKADGGIQLYNRRTRTSQSLIRLRLSMAKAHYQVEKLFESSIIEDGQAKGEQSTLYKEQEKVKAQYEIFEESTGLTEKEKPRLRRRKTRKHAKLATLLGGELVLPSSEVDIAQSGDVVTEKRIFDQHDQVFSEVSDGLSSAKTTSVAPVDMCDEVKPPAPIRKLEAILPHYVQTIMCQLEQLGFQVYLVGGCIRDMLLDKKPSDFDMICNASTLVVAQNVRLGVLSKHIPNLYKIFLPDISIDLICVEELDLAVDAKQRDFTCNALYMDSQCQLFDPLNGTGIDDVLQKKVIVIGEPSLRFEEDPIRLLRLVRLVAQHQFTITDALQDLVKRYARLLRSCQLGRLQFQIRKLFLQGSAVNNYRVLKQLTLLPAIFTETPCTLFQEAAFDAWIVLRLAKTDEMVRLSQPVSLYYILAMFKVAPSVIQEEFSSKQQPVFSAVQPQLYQFFKKTDHLTHQILTEAREAISLKA